MPASNTLGLKTPLALAVVVSLCIGQAKAGFCFDERDCGPKEFCSSYQCSKLGTNVTMHISPGTLTPPLSNSLTLTCTVGNANGTVSTAHLVDETDNGDSKSQTRMFQYAENFSYLSSIVIAKDGQVFASINKHFGASPLRYFDNINVTGHISGGSGKLDVNWSHTTFDQKGNYTCSAEGFDETGNSVTIFASAMVGQSAPTLDNVVKHIGEMLNDQKAENAALKLQLQNQNIEVTNLEQNSETQKAQFDQKIKTQKSQIDQNNMQLKDLATKISVSSHVESGSVYCGGPFGKVGGHNDPTSNSIPVTFTRPYTSPPAVALSVRNAQWFHNFDGSTYAWTTTVTKATPKTKAVQ